MDWANLDQFGPALFACKALPFVSCKKKMPMPHSTRIGYQQNQLNVSVNFLSFFCTYHPRTPPKGTCGLLKMVPPKIEPKHGLLDINRIDSMHLSTPASKSNDWCVVFFYVRCQIHSDVIDTLMKFLLLLCCM